MHTHSWDNADRCDAHSICLPCMQRHVELKILDEAVWNIRCPGEGCRYRLLEADVSTALEASKVQGNALRRYTQLRAESGAERLQETLRHLDDSEAWVVKVCQACPGCLVLAWRADGCFHLACRCGQEFCYGCGAPGDGEECLCKALQAVEREEADAEDSGVGQRAWLGAYLLVAEESRLGDGARHLPRFYPAGVAQRLEWCREASLWRRQANQAFALRRQQAIEEAAAETQRRAAFASFGLHLSLAGYDIPAPPPAPEDAYQHRLNYEPWYDDESDDEPSWDDDHDDDDAEPCNVSGSLWTERARRRESRGAPLQHRSVKARASPGEERRATAPTHPRRQRKADVAGSRGATAQARHLREIKTKSSLRSLARPAAGHEDGGLI